jgi:DNA-binding MarR family transcriptional regulator
MCGSCPPTASPLPDLSAEEFALWAGFAQTHAALARQLDADLRTAHGLPLGELEILLWLAHGPCERMRMAALAETVPLSPSGVSRAVERLAARGLVRRDRCPEDRRGAYAVLTESGVARVRAASATYAAGIRGAFLDALTSEERELLARIWERLLARTDMAPDGAWQALTVDGEDKS